ncbi:hypothetical protein BCP01_209 [Bacillus phage BCP01]|nr:hypothetical protein BCP01_209 [Bacillus phage BCP01]
MTKIKVTCIHCAVEEMVSEAQLKGTYGEKYWACQPCQKEKRETVRTYKMLFMDQGVFGASLLKDVTQEALGEIINELLTVHKGILLGLTEVKENREEKSKVVH